jgi:hypothetical protein
MLWKVSCVSGRRVGHGSAVYPGTRARSAGGRRRPGAVGRAYRATPRGAPVPVGLRFAFYGRVSTEDWQDPVTSRARQRDQAGVLVAGHGIIVAEFFDSGHSRTLRWARRAAFGHTKIGGKSLLVRGLNALAATISTPLGAPVIAAVRTALYQARVEPVREAVESGPPPLGPATPPLERVPALLDAVLCFKLDNRPLALALEETGSSSPYQAAHYERWHDLLQAMLEQIPGLDDGDFTAHALLAATRADLIEYLTGHERVPRERMRAQLASFTAGVLGGSGSVLSGQPR